MWQCPGCNLIAINPELLAGHMKTTPKCKGKSFNLRGWQGVELDGLPRSKNGETLWLNQPNK
jgi:hypothetical protein